MADQRVQGKAARVTGRVAAGQVGEVMVEVRGGSEAYHAYPADPDDEFAPGETVVVVEHHPPRTVTVAPLGLSSI